MNVGALQSGFPLGNKLPDRTNVGGGNKKSSFGDMLQKVTTSVSTRESQPTKTSKEVPSELISDLISADSSEDLQRALELFQGVDSVELSVLLGEKNSITLDDLSTAMSMDSEKVLELLRDLLLKAGKSIEELKELTVSADIWTLLSTFDGLKVSDLESLNNSILRNGSMEAVQLLAFLKTVEISATQIVTVKSMEENLHLFQRMMADIATQFDQELIALGKQKLLDLPLQKFNFRMIPENNPTQAVAEEKDSPKQMSELQASTPNITTVMKGDLVTSKTNSTAQSESLMRELQILFKRSNFGQVNGSNRMLVKLYPEHLGQIRIELLETNGVITARILASTAFAKGMLDSQLHQLKHAFTNQNIQVDRIDIAQTIQESSRNEREQTFNEHFEREQQTDKEKKESHSEENLSFEEYLIELEV
ncbi:flagellar hook-length control protein FliK [Sporosarcina sp. FSL W8-0480]|uniref:flagellar hook-length control protein FliK n=1 Tax=Sporosarcina sp. FSL W8-0480 TaxID=2954701 RepID=UPI0030DA7E5F